MLERRIDWGPGYRVYFGRDGERLVILLCGGTKKRQQRDIAAAHERWADQKARRKDREREDMSKSPIGRPFHEIVQGRAGREPAFAGALLEEAVECMLAGELPTARSLIRDAIKGSMGYAELSRRTGTSEKSLVRMFGPSGNPTAANLSSVLRELQRHGRVRLRVRSEPAPGRRPGKKREASPTRVA